MADAPTLEQLRAIVGDQLNNILNGPAAYNADGASKSVG
jgi:hypothetical protein